ncbi:MAG: HAMP domain-containing sensor histidine kinase [Gemmatimonadota bacterium]
MHSPDRAPGGPVQSRAKMTIGLLVAALLLTGALGYQAWHAERAHRQTTDRVLHEYAELAALRFFVEGMTDFLSIPLAFGHLAGLHVKHDAELPPLESMIPTADTVATCTPTALNGERFYFRFDLRDGRMVTSGVRPPDDVLALVTDSVRQRIAAAFADRETWYLAPMFRSTASGPRALLYVAVRDLEDTPIATYGFETCNAAIWESNFRRIMRTPLLPATLVGKLPNDSLLSVDVTAWGQFSGHYRSPMNYPPIYTAEVNDTAGRRGGIRLRVTLRPDIAEQLVLGGLPESRLPLLLGLLGLTGGVLIVAVMQIRREQELMRLRADFTTSVSHELRTPLAEVLLYAESLELDRFPHEVERREAVRIIAQEANHLTQIVDNVLQLSRAERRTLRIVTHRLGLAREIREAVDKLSVALEARLMQVTLALDGRTTVRANADALRQIVINILDNAIKYGRVGQTITIGTQVEGEMVRLEFEDQGNGIMSQDRERVWDPFTRLIRPDDSVPGSGIGLAVTRALVLAQQGRCWIEPGIAGGARVVVLLPADTPLSSPQDARAE